MSSTTLPRNKPAAMIVAGVMSGTSADGVDVALCRIEPPRMAGGSPKLTLLGHRNFPYRAELRSEVLRAMNGGATTAAELARLSWRLGEVYAASVAGAVRSLEIMPQLVACHGQTVHHQSGAAEYLGSPLRCTLQIGEPAMIAERLRLPVVSDFRPADLAAGGQGAPLVPMLDYTLFQRRDAHRVLLNIGGIANVTVLPAGGAAEDILAFDTGPGNMIIDALMAKLVGRSYDCGGATASRGKALRSVLDDLLQNEYFSDMPPKSCGREQFGAAYAEQVGAVCTEAGGSTHDVIATASALTVETIAEAYRNFCVPHLRKTASFSLPVEMLAAGGGSHNSVLMRGLRDALQDDGVSVGTTDRVGIEADAKEAAAFALLGWLTWHGLPGNMPSATGAKRPALLGKVTLA